MTLLVLLIYSNIISIYFIINWKIRFSPLSDTDTRYQSPSVNGPLPREVELVRPRYSNQWIKYNYNFTFYQMQYLIYSSMIYIYVKINSILLFSYGIVIYWSLNDDLDVCLLNTWLIFDLVLIFTSHLAFPEQMFLKKNSIKTIDCNLRKYQSNGIFIQIHFKLCNKLGGYLICLEQLQVQVNFIKV